ncbi:hypothetical protein [Amphibacillus jilinensis]|uniref:hypothetical protein n=1 Tax=Amphibacillus jilinensis TaxID=1216008 RepID=UPI0003108EEB|nr:hypothetical protein [Amphibacillus jilinensis]
MNEPTEFAGIFQGLALMEQKTVFSELEDAFALNTTVNDIVGLFIYFSVATSLINYL